MEDFVPGLRAARAAEKLNRALAFAMLRHSILGAEVLPIAPIHRLSLQLVRNAFAFPGVEPAAGDVFQFLWSLNPRHRANGGRFGFLAERRIRKLAARVDLKKAARTIREYMAEQLQDAPEAGEGEEIPANYVHWMAAEAGFWINIHGGFTLESYQRTPYLILQQLMRTWRCNHPLVSRNDDGTMRVDAPNFVNASDRILLRWQRDRSKEIGSIIAQQRERLPN